MLYLHIDKLSNAGNLTETKKQKDLQNDFLEENQSPIDLFYNHLVQKYGNGDVEQFYRWLNGKTTEEIYVLYKMFRNTDEKNIEIQKTFTGRFKRKLPAKIELKRGHLEGHSFTTYILNE